MKIMNLPKVLQPFYCEDIIRIGKDHDGGYLVSKEDVLKSSRLLSFGVGGDISFEEDFLKLNDCESDLYDDRDFEFEGFLNDKRRMHKALVGSNGVSLASMLTDKDQNVFLKCDIEGSEYDLLDDIIANSHKFSGLTMEFHDVNIYGAFNELTNFISKIDQKLIHIHVNTWTWVKLQDDSYLPSVIEVTFSSNKNISFHRDIQLPHKLDQSNDPDGADFFLTFQ